MVKRRKNPVNIDQYGDLFYDMAGEFDNIVTATMGEIFEGDEIMRTSETVDMKKFYRAKKLIAGGIVKAWLRRNQGRY